MAGMGRGPTGNVADQLPGDNGVIPGATNPLIGLSAERIYAAGPLRAMVAAQPRLSEGALGLNLVEAVPGGLIAVGCSNLDAFFGSRVAGLLLADQSLGDHYLFDLFIDGLDLEGYAPSTFEKCAVIKWLAWKATAKLWSSRRNGFNPLRAIIVLDGTDEPATSSSYLFYNR
jgi:hypothetical protein